MKYTELIPGKWYRLPEDGMFYESVFLFVRRGLNGLIVKDCFMLQKNKIAFNDYVGKICESDLSYDFFEISPEELSEIRRAYIFQEL